MPPSSQPNFAVAAASPFFLYAASNAGSLLGLLAYPFLIAIGGGPTSEIAFRDSRWALILILLIRPQGLLGAQVTDKV